MIACQEEYKKCVKCVCEILSRNSTKGGMFTIGCKRVGVKCVILHVGVMC